MRFFVFVILTIGLAHATQAATELFFPVEKSQVKILPQRFEYQLIDKDQLRVGDVLMNANEIDFKLIPLNKARTQFKIRFRWPAGLLRHGEIAIKDNSGKAIFIKSLKKEQVKIAPAGDGDMRTDTAWLETSEDVGVILKEIQKYPFFKFCIHREEPLTKIYLCSKDLYVKKNTTGLEILARDSYRPESFVEINGRSVGNQGMIFLNSAKDFISMRTLLLSGATLELDTRMKSIDFKDVVLSEDGQKIIVRASGAEPINPKLVKKKTATEWEAELESERPYTYLKGEGDLPLRQEFLIQGSVRKDDVKVTVTSDSPEMTASDSVRLQLNANPSLALQAADKKSSVRKLGNNSYEWTLLDLRKNEKNRRFLRVTQGSDDFFAAYDVERIASFDANVRLMFPLWAEANLLWAPSTRWAVDFQYNNQLQKGSDDPSIQYVYLGAQYRFPQGVHTRNQAFYGELYIQQILTDVKNFMPLGVAFGAELKNPESMSRLAQWTYLRLRFPFMSNDSDFKMKMSYELDASLRHFTHSTLYYEVGLKHQTYHLESDTAEFKSGKTFGFGGVGWIF